jgi:hypothetical protein
MAGLAWGGVERVLAQGPSYGATTRGDRDICFSHLGMTSIDHLIIVDRVAASFRLGERCCMSDNLCDERKTRDLNGDSYQQIRSRRTTTP